VLDSLRGCGDPIINESLINPLTTESKMIDIEHISKHYVVDQTAVPAISDINLRIEQGEEALTSYRFNTGTREQILGAYREVRDRLKRLIEERLLSRERPSPGLL